MDPSFSDLQEGRKDVACAGIDGRTEHRDDPAQSFSRRFVFDSISSVLKYTKDSRLGAKTSAYNSNSRLELQSLRTVMLPHTQPIIVGTSS